MFCEKCGAKLEDNAEFCTQCGAKISSVKNPVEKVDDTEIQMTVKPTFKFGYLVLPSLIAYTIIIVFFAFVFGVMEPSVGVTIFVVGFILLVLILGIKAMINKKQYNSLTYNFYKTKVIFEDSFLNLSQKEVKYKYIREVTMNQTFIQRFFNIGNIVLFTNAETGFGNGIRIVNVENVQEVYKNIKSIINA